MSDDDSAVAPPPDPTKLGRHLTVGTTVFESSLRLKRTLIPVLLTLGVLLPVTASLKWITPRDSAFASWSTGLAIALMFVGLCLLAAAVFNMLHVRDMLSRAARDSLTRRRTNS